VPRCRPAATIHVIRHPSCTRPPVHADGCEPERLVEAHARGIRNAYPRIGFYEARITTRRRATCTEPPTPRAWRARTRNDTRAHWSPAPHDAARVRVANDVTGTLADNPRRVLEYADTCAHRGPRPRVHLEACPPLHSGAISPPPASARSHAPMRARCQLGVLPSILEPWRTSEGGPAIQLASSERGGPETGRCDARCAHVIAAYLEHAPWSCAAVTSWLRRTRAGYRR